MAVEDLASPSWPALAEGNVYPLLEDIEEIDPRTGTLGLRIPLGNHFPLGPRLSYRFELVYRSDFLRAGNNPMALSRAAPPKLAVPPQTNAGLGWQLHLGLLRSQSSREDTTTAWVYVSLDGQSHSFHALPGRALLNRHGLEVAYTKDGSHLRLQRTAQDQVDVEAPDGTVSRFLRTDSPLKSLGCGSSQDGCWRLTERWDPYGNRLWLEYDQDGDHETWTVFDSTGRHHVLRFGSPSFAEAGPPGRHRYLESLELAAFAGERAVYELVYEEGFLPFGCNASPSPGQESPGQASPGQAFPKIEPLLKRIRIPGDRGFDFRSSRSILDACSPATSRIVGMTLPTGGRVSYSYARWPTACPAVSTAASAATAASWRGVLQSGLFQRRLRLPRGPVVATWKYRPRLEELPGSRAAGGCRTVREITVDGPVSDGAFRRDIYYLTLPGPEAVSAPLDTSPLGSPFHPGVRIGATVEDFRYLSRKVYECLARKGCGEDQLRRSVYVRYLSQQKTAGCELSTSSRCRLVDPVLQARRTVFHDDDGRFLEEEWSRFDGVVTPRRHSRRDDFLGIERVWVEDLETTATGEVELEMDFLSDRLRSPVAPRDYLPPPEAPWILHPIRRRERRQGEIFRVEELSNDRGGLPSCRRFWRDADARSPQDLVLRTIRGIVPGRDAGLPVREIRAGGDHGKLSIDILCSTLGDTPSGSRFERKIRYQYLVPAFRGGSEDISEAVLSIDRHTGRPSRRQESSGEVTTYHFDLQGRLRTVAPEPELGQAESVLKYRNPATGPASVDVLSMEGDRTLNRRRLIFDPFGRPLELRRSLPSSAEAPAQTSRHIRLDPLGRRRSVVPDSASRKFYAQQQLRWSRYDPFDRPRRIEAEEGTQIELSYSGQRRVAASIPVRLKGNAFEPVRQRWRFDPQGRLEGVVGPRLATRMDRGPDGELRSLIRQALELEGTIPKEAQTSARPPPRRQRRGFLWDGRGFLTAETHPELGSEASPSGKIQWGRDARGRAIDRRAQGPRLTLELDPRGRRTRLRSPSGLMTEASWGSAHLPGDFRRARIARVNRFSEEGKAATWRVSQSDSHRATSHRPFFRRTQILRSPTDGSPPSSWFFEQGWRYSPLGSIHRWAYPRAVVANAGTAEGGRFDVESEHMAGLTIHLDWSLDWPLDRSLDRPGSGPLSFTYNPDRSLRGIRWPAGGRLRRTLPRTGSERLRATTREGRTSYDSGEIRSDPQGFRWADGAERYVVDEEGRLVIATLRRACPRCREELAYDAFDNITNIYRDERFDWWLSVDRKNRLLKPPGDDQGRVTYDEAGRIHRLTWSWQLPPPALQPLTFDYGAAGGLQRIRAGAPERPYRDWQLIPGPDGRPTVVLNGIDGGGTIALRDLDGRPLNTWKIGKGQPPAPSYGALRAHREFLYGPGGLLGEKLAGADLRYIFADGRGTPRFAIGTGGETSELPLFYPFGHRFDRNPAEGPRESPADAFFAPTFAGHERLPEGLSLDAQGRPYSPQLLRFLTPARSHGTWNLYSFLPPQLGQAPRTGHPEGPAKALQLHQQRIWGLLSEDEYEGLDIPVTQDRGQLPVQKTL